MHFFKKIILLLLVIISFSCKTRLERQGWQRAAIVSHWDTLNNKKAKELVVERRQLNNSSYYMLTFFENDSSGKIINKPFFAFERPFRSDIAYYKWESDSLCYIKLMSQGNVQASLKYIEHSDSSSSFGFLDDLKQ